MKRVMIFLLGLSLLCFALSGAAPAWQGRMGGDG